MESNDSAPGGGDRAGERRDRLVAALLHAGPSVVLLRCAVDEAHLLDLSGKRQFVIFTVRPHVTGAALASAIRAVVKNVQPGDLPLHVVAVGISGESRQRSINRFGAPSGFGVGGRQLNALLGSRCQHISTITMTKHPS